jgi:hypothetical protein
METKKEEEILEFRLDLEAVEREVTPIKNLVLNEIC